MGRREERLIEQLQPLLAPDERATHLFVANHGTSAPSKLAMLGIAVTERSIVSARVTHMLRWKIAATEVARWPRVPFPDLPDGPLGFERWTWNGLDLWLDRRARKAAVAANAELRGAGSG